MDYRGLVLIARGVALSVFGFQQSAIWGWSNPGTGLCIAGGLVLLVVFYFVELRTASPLIQVSIFRIRAFLVENLVLGISMLVFIPVFFFASEYAQIALGKTASQAGLYPALLLHRLRDRRPDRRSDARPGRGQAPGGARLRPGGGGLLPVGRARSPSSASAPRSGTSSWPGPAWASCSARPAPTRSTGPRGSPTARPPASPRPCATTRPASAWPSSAPSWSSSLRSRLDHLAGGPGRARRPGADRGVAASPSPRAGAAAPQSIPHFVRLDFAYATRTVLYVMAVIMAVAAVVGPRRAAARACRRTPEADGVDPATTA